MPKKRRRTSETTNLSAAMICSLQPLGSRQLFPTHRNLRQMGTFLFVDDMDDNLCWCSMFIESYRLHVELMTHSFRFNDQGTRLPRQLRMGYPNSIFGSTMMR